MYFYCLIINKVQLHLGQFSPGACVCLLFHLYEHDVGLSFSIRDERVFTWVLAVIQNFSITAIKQRLYDSYIPHVPY